MASTKVLELRIIIIIIISVLLSANGESQYSTS